MELSKQVISLELAKQLKELGIKQDSLWWWAIRYDKDGYVKAPILVSKLNFIEGVVYEVYSAYTTSELGEMLSEHTYSFRFWRDHSICWGCIDKERMNSKNFEKGHSEDGHTEADCRAKMLCWLIENNKLEVKQ